jgi:hypothetical protein
MGERLLEFARNHPFGPEVSPQWPMKRVPTADVLVLDSTDSDAVELSTPPRDRTLVMPDTPPDNVELQNVLILSGTREAGAVPPFVIPPAMALPVKPPDEPPDPAADAPEATGTEDVPTIAPKRCPTKRAPFDKTLRSGHRCVVEGGEATSANDAPEEGERPRPPIEGDGTRDPPETAMEKEPNTESTPNPPPTPPTGSALDTGGSFFRQ